EDGWLTITGRLKELIIRGGENISINEVEAAVGAHPLVREVAAFAVPDERFGERVGVAVVLDAAGDPSAAASFDVAACREWVESQGLARFKAPEVVRVVPELPLLPTGKVDRRALRTSG